ncbi:MAG: carotenoid oxygenase family protein [Archangium sp.]|nr:carotenoid oxygenase family protein [Archangium sp.]
MRLPPPFGWSKEDENAPVAVSVQGTIPAWLRGTLMRTAPCLYELGEWKAGHWFDGLALLYSFQFGGSGVAFKQRLLESDSRKELSAGVRSRAAFRTEMKRGFFNRLFHPIPRTTDNTNVNVVPWEGAWLSMTETSHQHVIDGDTLETRGTYKFQDGLGRTTLSAHPFPNPGVAKSLINIGSEMGIKNGLCIYRQQQGSPSRTIEGRVRLERLPYVHSFGVSPRYATLLEHPFTVSPRDMLWSNRGFIEHFKWQPERGGRIWLLNRADGTSRAYETKAFFCFHTINQFEDGDDVVLDFLAWDDPSIIEQLKIELLAKGHPPVQSKWVRARLKKGQSKADFEVMSETPFEFPVLNLKRSQCKPTEVVWGATITGSTRPPGATAPGGETADGADAAVLKVVHGKPVERFTSKGWTHGEPVMVPAPNATADDEGVLLAVASHAEGTKTGLFVIDAKSLTEIARVEIDVGLPLGFHGSFRLDA